jgi:hypothetical protein
MGSSLASQYGLPQTGDFEGPAQYPIVRFNIQPTTKRKMFSNFQLNETSSSNQPAVAPYDFPSVFHYEPTPSTSANATSSTSRKVKAACLRPLPSI